MLIRKYRDNDREKLISLWQAVFPDDPPHNEPSEVIAAKLAGTPSVLGTLHVRMDLQDRPLLARQTKLLELLTERMIAVSAGVEDQLVNDFGFASESVLRVNNGQR